MEEPNSVRFPSSGFAMDMQNQEWPDSSPRKIFADVLRSTSPVSKGIDDSKSTTPDAKLEGSNTPLETIPLEKSYSMTRADSISPEFRDVGSSVSQMPQADFTTLPERPQNPVAVALREVGELKGAMISDLELGAILQQQPHLLNARVAVPARTQEAFVHVPAHTSEAVIKVDEHSQTANVLVPPHPALADLIVPEHPVRSSINVPEHKQLGELTVPEQRVEVVVKLPQQSQVTDAVIGPREMLCQVTLETETHDVNVTVPVIETHQEFMIEETEELCEIEQPERELQISLPESDEIAALFIPAHKCEGRFKVPSHSANGTLISPEHETMGQLNIRSRESQALFAVPEHTVKGVATVPAHEVIATLVIPTHKTAIEYTVPFSQQTTEAHVPKYKGQVTVDLEEKEATATATFPPLEYKDKIDVPAMMERTQVSIPADDITSQIQALAPSQSVPMTGKLFAERTMVPDAELSRVGVFPVRENSSVEFATPPIVPADEHKSIASLGTAENNGFSWTFSGPSGLPVLSPNTEHHELAHLDEGQAAKWSAVRHADMEEGSEQLPQATRNKVISKQTSKEVFDDRLVSPSIPVDENFIDHGDRYELISHVSCQEGEQQQQPFSSQKEVFDDRLAASAIPVNENFIDDEDRYDLIAQVPSQEESKQPSSQGGVFEEIALSPPSVPVARLPEDVEMMRDVQRQPGAPVMQHGGLVDAQRLREEEKEALQRANELLIEMGKQEIDHYNRLAILEDIKKVNMSPHMTRSGAKWNLVDDATQTDMTATDQVAGTNQPPLQTQHAAVQQPVAGETLDRWMAEQNEADVLDEEEEDARSPDSFITAVAPPMESPRTLETVGEEYVHYTFLKTWQDLEKRHRQEMQQPMSSPMQQAAGMQEGGPTVHEMVQAIQRPMMSSTSDITPTTNSAATQQPADVVWPYKNLAAKDGISLISVSGAIPSVEETRAPLASSPSAMSPQPSPIVFQTLNQPLMASSPVRVPQRTALTTPRALSPQVQSLQTPTSGQFQLSGVARIQTPSSSRPLVHSSVDAVLSPFVNVKQPTGARTPLSLNLASTSAIESLPSRGSLRTPVLYTGRNEPLQGSQVQTPLVQVTETTILSYDKRDPIHQETSIGVNSTPSNQTFSQSETAMMPPPRMASTAGSAMVAPPQRLASESDCHNILTQNPATTCGCLPRISRRKASRADS
eukprot:GILK01013879.1.p1 GENE.GILK01013879.1~~GILK01013879.1.p1  ORF type:complete len:1195 (-),score=199.82 GILK01013879.1:160-3744(-)